jgi:hypothetical protein
MLSDRQCEQISEYVKSGGSIMASFETSLYDENLQRRANFGLAGLLGIDKSGDVIGTNGNAYYGRIEQLDPSRQHAILEGFHNANWIPGAENRIPLKPVASPVLTVVPGFVHYPPELAYPPVSHTDEPAVVLGESGASRMAYFPGDIERTYWLTGHGDLLRLLHNTVRWLTHDERVVGADGEGFLEIFAWETAPGYAVHLVNYTNPNAQHCWIQSTFAVGAQTVTMKLPPGVRTRSVELLKAGHNVPFEQEQQFLHFTVPGVEDYEVAAIAVT